MISRFKIQELPQVEQVYNLKDLENLPGCSFLVVKVSDALSSDEVEDLREEIENVSPVPVVVCTKHFTIYEIVDKIEHGKPE